jgi:hypothetical protein
MLPMGDTTISLTNIASDAAGGITLYDALGTEIAEEHTYTPGSSVVLKKNLGADQAGPCFIRVQPSGVGPTVGEGSTVPAFYTQQYALRVTNP